MKVSNIAVGCTVEFENSLPPGHTPSTPLRSRQTELGQSKSPLFFLDILLVDDQNYRNYRFLH